MNPNEKMAQKRGEQWEANGCICPRNYPECERNLNETRRLHKHFASLGKIYYICIGPFEHGIQIQDLYYVPTQIHDRDHNEYGYLLGHCWCYVFRNILKVHGLRILNMIKDKHDAEIAQLQIRSTLE